MGWVDRSFPEVKKILLLRHPCAVAVSKESLRKMRWMDDPSRFLEDADLLEDHLSPFSSLLSESRTYFERQIMIWASIHYVAFRQLNRSRVHLVFYEDLCTDLAGEMARIASFLGWGRSGFPDDPRLQEAGRRPSSKTRPESAINLGADRAFSWLAKTTPDQRKCAGEILAEFGLGELFGQDGTPLRRNAEKLLLETDP
jgi:hypothetical protein